MSGMYSDCLDPNQCQGVGACLTIGNPATDGFCTNTSCTNPVVDCDPSPGGTATPGCFAADGGGMAVNVCALDCSAGKTCPTGMACTNVTDFNMATQQICV